MSPEAVTQQIRDVINALISSSLVNHQRYPACRRSGRQSLVVIDGSPDLSLSMKSLPYEEVYKGLREAGAYHMQMVDGALIQLLYCFDGSTLQSHRLAYFPSPLLESYDEAAEIYNNEQLFAEIFSRTTVRAPLRFDYSASDRLYVDVDHPRSHLTIGQQKGCRIPADAPLTPFRFMRFVLRNFYGPAYAELSLDRKATDTRFDETISRNERQILHVIV